MYHVKKWRCTAVEETIKALYGDPAAANEAGQVLVEEAEPPQELRAASEHRVRKHKAREAVCLMQSEQISNSSCGKQAYLPEEFNQRLCEWILGMRVLEFPIFNDTVIGVANVALEGMEYIKLFKHGALGSDW